MKIENIFIMIIKILSYLYTNLIEENMLYFFFLLSLIAYRSTLSLILAAITSIFDIEQNKREVDSGHWGHTCIIKLYLYLYLSGESGGHVSDSGRDIKGTRAD